MMNDSGFKANRRQFLKGLLGSTLFLQSCSTLDEYLIEDDFDFNQEVVIVGGGISGLYAAYELKKNKIPFRLFEGSSRLGGKFQTVDSQEWGAFQFSRNDESLNLLMKELNLEKISLDAKSWSVKGGAEALISELVDITQGLIPEKQIRLQSQLQSITKFGSKYQLNFKVRNQGQERQRIYLARKVLLALPQNQLLNIAGLNDLKEVKPLLAVIKESKNWANLRLNLPIKELKSQLRNQPKNNFNKSVKMYIEKAFYRITPVQTASINVEIVHENLALTFRLNHNHPLRPIQNLEGFIQSFTDRPVPLNLENCKDWGDTDSRLSQPADFTKINWPGKRLRIVSEALISVNAQHVVKGTALPISSVESLLQLVNQEIQTFKLDI